MGRKILVVDDNHRFPLHVWRFLGRVIGFGIGTSNADEDIPINDWLVSDDKTLELFWANAEGTPTLPPLHDISIALVDVRGKRGYDYEQVYKDLRNELSEEKIFVVSSYGESQMRHAAPPIGVSKRNIWPKSRNLFRHLEKLFPTPTPCEFSDHHILVTGAGFERDYRGQTHGLPRTGQLIEETLKKAELFEGDFDDKTLIFPMPNKGLWERQRRSYHVSRLRQAAREGDLDTYFDLLLHHELKDGMEGVVGDDLEEALSDCHSRERDIREAFRESIRQRDWGQLKHALIATRLNWTAWITTNYTHFSNRAIHLWNEHTAQINRPWRVISTSVHAAVLMHEQQSWLNRDDRDRILFKLHGDIEDLRTMAIAGYDKASFSPLAIPVDPLHQVYTASEHYLRRILHGKDENVTFHIVGHGLHDIKLVNMLVSICNAKLDPQKTNIIVVDWGDPYGVADRLLDGGLQTDFKIFPLPESAAAYLHKLRYTNFDLSTYTPYTPHRRRSET